MKSEASMQNEMRYLHGGTPQRDMRRLGVCLQPVMDFSVNLNPLGPPPILQERWKEMLEAVQHYPSVEGDGVAYYYEKAFNIGSRSFLAGNGSTEMIYLIPRVFGFKRVAVLTPSYHDYERASRLAGAEVFRCPLDMDDGFALASEDVLLDLLDKVDALWMARPNNPTGNLFPKRRILALAEKFPQKWFIVDEAFVQFLVDWEIESLLRENLRPNILVLHSLTKFYAIAGLRLGGVIGSEPAISRLRKAKEPWTVNGIADRMASLLVECNDYENETRSVVKKEGGRVFEGLHAVEGVVPYPPTANYILCQWVRTGSLDDIMRYLLSNGVYLRDCRNFPGLEANFFRIGLRSRKENDRLLSLLSSFQPT